MKYRIYGAVAVGFVSPFLAALPLTAHTRDSGEVRR
jgi:hypothetical protein